LNATSARRVPLLDLAVHKLGKESLAPCQIISNYGAEECQ